LTLELDRSGPRLFPVQVELDQYKGLLQFNRRGSSSRFSRGERGKT